MTLVYLEVLLMTILALASIVLLYVCRVLHQKKYRQHAVFDPLTPAEQQFLNHPYRYVIRMMLFVAFLGWFFANYTEGALQQFYFGIFISLWSMVLGYVVGAALIFLYSTRNPEKISGQAVFEGKHLRGLHIQAPFMASVVLLSSLAIVQPTPFVWGSLVAAISIVVISAYMHRK